MDREADDCALFCLLQQGEHRFVIRLMHDRPLAADEPGAPRKLDEALARITATTTRQVPLSRRAAALRSPKQIKAHPTRTARLATLAIGSTTVTLPRPRNQPKTLSSSETLNIVRIWEIATPEGEEPVAWTLVTSEPVDTEQDALRTVDRYRARWTIEDYFKALKTGCTYEERQLEDFEGLTHALALFAPIAWHLLCLRSTARQQPQRPPRASSVPPRSTCSAYLVELSERHLYLPGGDVGYRCTRRPHQIKRQARMAHPRPRLSRAPHACAGLGSYKISGQPAIKDETLVREHGRRSHRAAIGEKHPSPKRWRVWGGPQRCSPPCACRPWPSPSRSRSE